jgi:hypothetical protein
MAADIKGKQVAWGVAALIATVHTATTAGIVQSFSWGAGGETDEITDEDADIVTRIDHGAKNSLSMEVLCVATSALPAKGDELVFASAVDGVPIDVGRTVVDTAEVSYSDKDKKRISVTATQYPEMAADA